MRPTNIARHATWPNVSTRRPTDKWRALEDRLGQGGCQAELDCIGTPMWIMATRGATQTQTVKWIVGSHADMMIKGTLWLQ